MTRIVVSPEAENDLAELTAQIADAANEAVALTYVDRIVATIERLARIPLAAARLVPQLGDGLRCHLFGNYNLYLRYDAPLDVLYVVRVLHGRRDIDASLFKG